MKSQQSEADTEVVVTEPVSSERSIIVISWGRNGRSSWSFHKCILIADSIVTEVNRDTKGTHWDWGSIVEDTKVTEHVPVQMKRFSPSMYDKGQAFRNSYSFKGTSDWPDAKIKQLYDRIGDTYNVMHSNCRIVAEAIARSLSAKSQDVTIARAMNWYYSRRQFNVIWISPPGTISGAFFQDFEGDPREFDEENKERGITWIYCGIRKGLRYALHHREASGEGGRNGV